MIDADDEKFERIPSPRDREVRQAAAKTRDVVSTPAARAAARRRRQQKKDRALMRHIRRRA